MAQPSERRAAFEAVASLASRAFAERRYDAAMSHLERAHVLGQP